LQDRVSGALAEDDTQLTKFHGIYQQDDRDLRPERAKKLLDKAYMFMARVRIPGGVMTPAQWLAMQAIAEARGNGTLRLTTRQTIQFHGVIKSNLKQAIRAINDELLDTIAACGDVNSNVIATPNPYRSAVHAEVLGLARRISEHLRPRTRAYHEIWLDGELVAGGEEEDEPIYGRTYLPRKFKIALAVPPLNDVDVFAHDLGRARAGRRFAGSHRRVPRCAGSGAFEAGDVVSRGGQGVRSSSYDAGRLCQPAGQRVRQISNSF